MKQKPTPLSSEYLCERFTYKDGRLFWKKRIPDSYGFNKRYAGKEAGGIDDDGYWKIKIYGKWYRRHRIVWAMHFGDAGSMQIDHVNGIRSDDRICNLRTATAQQNAFNRKRQINNKSGCKGVFWVEAKKKWTGLVLVFRKPYSAGYFDSIHEAITASERLREKLHGEFCNHGDARVS
ncbi:endonuclease [Serratia liquefaciens ATCC 27592]|uniref:HNH endonuclease n=1 Tax=Serratia liquefaciens TaxID=614 RepID=UPI00035861B8|nr:HNH endonuclease [Serratia liquefaciens]AGQ28771.1 endonuclease [Serratia liquefaciens ATCC 27592]